MGWPVIDVDSDGSYFIEIPEGTINPRKEESWIHLIAPYCGIAQGRPQIGSVQELDTTTTNSTVTESSKPLQLNRSTLAS